MLLKGRLRADEGQAGDLYSVERNHVLDATMHHLDIHNELLDEPHQVLRNDDQLWMHAHSCW
jgi:hypothetical protein